MDNVGLVTGASSGIGKELARIHAANGRDLVVVARREDELQQLKAELEAEYRVEVYVLAKDLNAHNACPEIAAELKDEGIFVEYLFNNAGFGLKGEFHKQDWKKLNNMMMLNMSALTELTHLMVPAMVEYGEGRVLNTSSTAGFMPGPLQAVYFATKAYVNSFSKAIAYELRDTGVSVTALCPGAVKTEFAEVADLAGSKLFESARSAHYTAQRGYDAMEAGVLEEITEPSLKVMIKAGLPFLPEKLGMAQIAKMQA